MALNLNILPIEINFKDGINLVFIGDGFTSQQQDLYHNKVQVGIEGIFSFKPFDKLRKYFNVYSIPTVSNESGISYKTHPNNPITEVIKDTYLGSFFNRGGMIRLAGFDKNEEVEEELTRKFKNRVFLILISNTGTYGGSGQFPDNEFMTVTHITMETQYNKFKELLIHEFGHSFCGLADEYGGNCVSDRPANWELPKYDRPNVTDDIVNKRKWDGIVSNPQYIQGANYCNTGWWRSSNSSIMRGWFEGNTLLDEVFNEVSVYHIKKRIFDEIELAKKTKTYIKNEIVRDRFSLTLKNIFKYKHNIRINSDVRFEKNTICGNLWINKGCTLTIPKGTTVYYKNLVNNGTIINNGKLIKK